MKRIILSIGQKAAIAELAEHRRFVWGKGGLWTTPGVKTPNFGTRTINGLMEMGILVREGDATHRYPGDLRFTSVVLAPHMNLETKAERELAIEHHIRGTSE